MIPTQKSSMVMKGCASFFRLKTIYAIVSRMIPVKSLGTIAIPAVKVDSEDESLRRVPRTPLDNRAPTQYP